MVNLKVRKDLFVVCVIGLVLLGGGVSQAFIPGQYADDAKTVGLYHLNQSSGTTVLDDASSGRTANNATLVGNDLPAWTTGAFGNGLHENMAASTGGSLQVVGGITNGTWHVTEMSVKWDYTSTGIPGEGGFAGYLFADWSMEFARVFVDDTNPLNYRGKIVFGFQSYGDPQWQQIMTPYEFSLQADVWTHLAFVTDWRYDAPIPYDYAAIYVNGQLAAEKIMIATEGHTRFPQSGGVLNIGNVNGFSWGGSIDEVRLTNGRRDPSEFGLKPCGEDGYNTSDINKDCYVDFKDFAILAESWMKCTDPSRLDCINCNELVFVPGTVDANTVALWHLNEGVGGTAYDETSYIPLTINAGGSNYTWATASAYGLDKCLYAPASNASYCKSAALPIANPSNITNQMTISAWIRPEGISPSGSYIASTNSSAILRLGGDSFGVIAEAVFYDWRDGYLTGSWAPAASKNVGMIDGNWHHIAGVYDGIPDGDGNANYYLYWDGVMVDHKTIDANDPDPAHAGREGLTLVDTGTGELYVGGSGDPNQAYQGYVDDVKVEKTARTKFFNTACE
ncbi:MAG: LamG domain-containing protein [Sedimentisphaerales bacterium]